MDDATREWFRTQGRIGGKRRAAALTAAQRRSQAQRAAQSRWYKGHRVKITQVLELGSGQIQAWATVWDPTMDSRGPSELKFPGVGPDRAVAQARAKQNARKWIIRRQAKRSRKRGNA